jgi:hypothetical protein
MLRTAPMKAERSGRTAACLSSVKGGWRILFTKALPQRFQDCFLLRRQLAKELARPRELALPDLLDAPAERNDGRPHVQRFVPLAQARELPGNDAVGGLHCILALAQIVLSHFLDAVDVRQRAAGNLPGRGINIARHSDIPEQERSAAALTHDALHIPAHDDVMRAAGGADYNVPLLHRLLDLAEADGKAVQFLRQRHGVSVRPVAHRCSADTLGNQMARRQLAHLASADDHHRPGMQVAQ